MKSKHLAKADFLRQLSIYATELYEMGDFTSTDPDRQLLSAKIEVLPLLALQLKWSRLTGADSYRQGSHG